MMVRTRSAMITIDGRVRSFFKGTKIHQRFERHINLEKRNKHVIKFYNSYQSRYQTSLILFYMNPEKYNR